MNPRLRRILALLPLLSWRALSSLYAQSVSGLVQTTEGKPLSSALVAVWDSLAERARGVTSPSGRFSILMPEGAVAVTLNVRAIGYLAQSQLIDPERSVGIIVALTPYAAPLPDITAHAVHTVCPNTDEPRARALWEAMRSRYRLAPLDQGWESVMRLSRDVVPLADVGTLDEARLLPARAGVSGGLRAASESFMRDSGYAQSLDRPGGFLVAIDSPGGVVLRS